MSWERVLKEETTVIKAKLSSDAMRELKDNMNKVSDTLMFIQNQFNKTPRTERNQEEHDVMGRVLNDISKRLADFKTYLEDLFLMEDFEFKDVEDFEDMLDRI